MSMPPAALTMTTAPPSEPSMTMAAYTSLATSIASSTSTASTGTPAGPVWCVTRVEPSIAAAASRASDAEATSLTPPALPRPPAWTCALTTTRPPSSSAAAATSSGVAGHLAPWHCDPRRCEDLFSLVLVQSQSVPPLRFHRLKQSTPPRSNGVLQCSLRSAVGLGWRRGWDSNPRSLSGFPVFKTGALNHSGHPSGRLAHGNGNILPHRGGSVHGRRG